MYVRSVGGDQFHAAISDVATDGVAHRVNSERSDAVLTSFLNRALSMTRAERGNVQLFDPTVGGLRIVAHQGFEEVFLKYFGVVKDDASVCGRAAKTLSQAVIEDVESDPGFMPLREIANVSGFRAVQSTPLISPSGALVGVVSTHYPDPHRPTLESLQTLSGYCESVAAVLPGLLRRLMLLERRGYFSAAGTVAEHRAGLRSSSDSASFGGPGRLPSRFIHDPERDQQPNGAPPVFGDPCRLTGVYLCYACGDFMGVLPDEMFPTCPTCGSIGPYKFLAPPAV